MLFGTERKVHYEVRQGKFLSLVAHHQENIYIILVNKSMHLSLIILHDMINNLSLNNFCILSTFDYAWCEIFILMIYFHYATESNSFFYIPRSIKFPLRIFSTRLLCMRVSGWSSGYSGLGCRAGIGITSPFS